MDELQLWCCVESDHAYFPVSISPSQTILELKQRIHAKADKSFIGCNANHLTLKKVDLGFHEIEDMGQYRPNTNDQPLLENRRISDVWPEKPPYNSLHVFVGLPAGVGKATVNDTGAPVLSKRPRAADDHDYRKPTDLAWLEEVHSKIWNRKDMKSQLFRKVELTPAHYAALYRRLKEQHPDRDSPDYVGSEHDVLSVKLDFLRSIPAAEALSTRHPEDNNDRLDDDDDDDDSEYGGNKYEVMEYLPSIFSFLDLSILDLKENVTLRLPLLLLLRQEYDYISELIQTRPQSWSGSVIVTGQPGMGVTTYLHFKIIEKMIEGCPFLYQAYEGTVYHVSKNGVEPIHSWSSEESIVAFLDGDEENFGPKDFLLRRSVQLIVASSPKGAHKSWTKRAGHTSRIFKLAVKVWSYDEAFLTGIFLHPFDLPFNLLTESIGYFGPNPRECFEAAHSTVALNLKKEEVKRQVQEAAAKGCDYIMQLLNNLFLTADGSHISNTVFQVFPPDTDKLQSLAECHYDVPSRWIFDVLLDKFKECEVNKAADFRRRVTSILLPRQ
ncbi:hypothetical protein BJV74DRAFT_887757 [Russula compacta]|nr:hypothetical protein BJV74DRAFT_887757 [Russula compacta]